MQETELCHAASYWARTRRFGGAMKPPPRQYSATQPMGGITDELRTLPLRRASSAWEATTKHRPRWPMQNRKDKRCPFRDGPRPCRRHRGMDGVGHTQWVPYGASLPGVPQRPTTYEAK